MRCSSSLARVLTMPKRTVLGLALVLCLGLAPPPMALAEAPPEPEAAASAPALWVVRDADSTLYLFGTLHFLRSDTRWRDARIDAALESASELVLEIADVNDTSAVMPLIQAHGLSPERPLSSLLTAGELTSLDTAARSMGQSAAQMDPMRPWLATVILSSAPTIRAGFAPGSGVDLALRATALAGGKTVSGLETPDTQIRMLSGFPEEGQLIGLRRALEAFEAAPVELEALVDAWSRGDIDAINASTVAPMRARSERLYQALLVERNQAWTDQIAARLAGAGTTFIAVGVLHLAGEDSVQRQLEARGIPVERLR
ncbi:TraB/GumN family protein [Brevundimonas sp.]|uniref:TraB/GumN family protein n=1 Tax=Brevundimonas sp. TaxID=1871086 RepID=UPI00286CAB43|nr:TraB/GumN family protein [Brevundimonas sp.]